MILPASLPHSTAIVETPDDIACLLCSLLPFWQSTSPSAVTVHPIPGGITNRIFKASAPSLSPLLVRVFGASDVFTAAQRLAENAIFAQLGAARIAPALLAVFGNGRVEQFLNARPVTLNEMGDARVMAGVAREMAKLHRFDPGGDGTREPCLWRVLDEWAAEATRLERGGAFAGRCAVDVAKCSRGMQAAREALCEGEAGRCSPVVFCHNDLLSGNVLVSLAGDAADVTLVDFEYSAFNYRGFDIGNFFCEAMGGTTDGVVEAARYPDEGKRRAFCAAYLGDGASQAEVEALMAEAERYGVVAHLYWGFWALVQSVGSQVEFPYLLFAEQRFEQFFRRWGE